MHCYIHSKFLHEYKLGLFFFFSELKKKILTQSQTLDHKAKLLF